MISLDDLSIDDDDVSGSYGNDDGEVNPGETVQFDLVVDNNGQNTATNSTATLSIVSGADQIETQIDMSENLGSVAPGSTTFPAAFSFEIKDDVPPGSDPVILSVSFNYDQGSRVDPADFRVLVGELELPIRSMTITHGTGQPVIINIDNMLVSNSGLGNLEGVEVEFTNASGGVLFIDDLSEVLGDINNCSGEEIEDGIHAILRNPSGCWNPITSDATFDLEISHRWGSETVTVNAYDVLTQGTVQPPSSSSLEVLEADQESIIYKWGNSTTTQTGWYLWKQLSSGPWQRENTFPLDGSLRHGTIDGLTAGTEYNIGVSVIGEQGQESSVVSFETSTTCANVSGWPVYLDGSTGSGPAITDIDNDGNDEVIAATSAGSVYIIERDGTKTKIYDSSYLFSGVAIGDVLIGGRDEIVVSGWNYDADTGKNGVIVVLKWTQFIGWTGTEIETTENVEQRTHEILTVPVLFNADNSGNLEIALRTFRGSYDGPANSWLYVWQYENSEWDLLNTLFPVAFPNTEWDFAPPVYIGDTDSDGYTELVVSKGIETLYWVEPETQQNSTWNVSSSFPATNGSITFDWNLGESYMAAVTDGGTCKIISVGRHGGSTSTPHYVTACINAENSGSSIWYSGVNQTRDCFGHIGGPAIGDVNDDNYLEIINQWIDYSYGNEDDQLVEYLNLSNGFRTVLSSIPYNPQQEDIAMSPMIIAGDEGDGLAVFGGMSTVSHGSVFSSGSPEFIAGSSYWSGDKMVSTPVVGNLDSDSDLEIIFSDDSGVLYALDMNLNTSSNDWPTLQHDLHRTGYFNFSGKGSLDTNLDLQLIGVDRERDPSLTLNSNQISVNVMIEGADDSNHSTTESSITQASSVNASISERIHNNSAPALETNDRIEIAPPSETVKVSLFAGTTLLETKRIPMQNGTHTVAFNYPRNLDVGELTAVVDPFMEYQEIDEENNILDLSGGIIESALANEIILNSSSNGVSISISVGILSGDQVSATLYSIDGRIVARNSIEVSSGEALSLDLSSETGFLPFGCYVVLLNDVGDLILRRKVLVIE